MKPTENPLIVFVSSAQGEFHRERRVCADAIKSLKLTRPWLFEYTPASADPVAQSYLTKVDECDIFVVLIGREVTSGVQREWNRALEQGKRRLVLVKGESSRPDKVRRWLSDVDVKYDHFDGVHELRERLLVALADELIRGYREFRLRKQDYASIFETIRGIQVTFSVHTIDASEVDDVRRAFPQLRELYPEVDTWLDGKLPALRRGEAEAFVATYGPDKAGIALTSDKGADVRKVSTLFILPRFQGTGVGPRLLYAVILRAAQEGVEKLYITVADERRGELERLLLRYGFQLEGVSPRRYRGGSWEWVWGKRLVRGILLQRDFHPFVRRYLFTERGFHTEATSEYSFTAVSDFDMTGRSGGSRSRCLVVTAYREEEASYRRAVEAANAMGVPLVFVGLEPVSSPRTEDSCLDAVDVESMFFPLIVERHVDGAVIPIRERFVSNLIPLTSVQQLLPPARVQLRTDNVYYRSPTAYRGLRRGAPLFFYETERASGPSRLIGEAKLLEPWVDEPRELFAKFGNLGVYSLEHLLATAPTKGQNAGKVLALKFDWYHEMERKLGLEAIREIVPRYNPITMRRIDFETACEIRRAAGWKQKALSFQ